MNLIRFNCSMLATPGRTATVFYTRSFFRTAHTESAMIPVGKNFHEQPSNSRLKREAVQFRKRTFKSFIKIKNLCCQLDAVGHQRFRETLPKTNTRSLVGRFRCQPHQKNMLVKLGSSPQVITFFELFYQSWSHVACFQASSCRVVLVFFFDLPPLASLFCCFGMGGNCLELLMLKNIAGK